MFKVTLLRAILGTVDDFKKQDVATPEIVKMLEHEIGTAKTCEAFADKAAFAAQISSSTKAILRIMLNALDGKAVEDGDESAPKKRGRPAKNAVPEGFKPISAETLAQNRA